MTNLTDNGQRQRDRLAMHVGLMAHLLQIGAPLVLIQAQCLSLRTMCKEFTDLDDEDKDAWVQVDTLLSDDVAAAIGDRFEVPDDLSGLIQDDDGEETP